MEKLYQPLVLKDLGLLSHPLFYCRVVENPTSSRRNMKEHEPFRALTPKDHWPQIVKLLRKNWELSHIETIICEGSRTCRKKKSRLNWICTELPSRTKKWKMWTTLLTTKIMSLIKRKMNFKDFWLGKIWNLIHTGWRIKLKGNWRNTKLFTK